MKGQFAMQAYQLADLQAHRRHGSERYVEFLSVPALSMGLYELDAGSQGLQSPHGEDEIYYVVSGQGVIRVGDEDQTVTTGSVIYVPAQVVHHFHSITEDLSMLVFFAPAEGTVAAANG